MKKNGRIPGLITSETAERLGKRDE